MIGTILNSFSVVHGAVQFIEYKDYFMAVAKRCGLSASAPAAAALRAGWRLDDVVAGRWRAGAACQARQCALAAAE
ncbi:hypothetical protein [Aquitalea magnusonii]|uniref:hypothetical protein n=1 Tax=Aquitalea magnusonii TaxID=332411 RepID=UPI0011B46673|nr:hypothetical protein [Aquitalea magnusonii]